MSDKTNFDRVGEFHAVMNQPVLTEPTVPPADRVRLRFNLILEEIAEVVGEFADANKANRHMAAAQNSVRQAIKHVNNAPDFEFEVVNLASFAKELTDSKVVIDGTGHEFGLNLNACSEEVHRSNMSKVDDDGKPVYNEMGKVQKGPNYSPADIESVLFPEGKEVHVPLPEGATVEVDL